MRENEGKKRQEPDWEDLAVMVKKMDELKGQQGKDSEGYKNQHKNVVNLIEKLNNNNKGFASISDTRAVLAIIARKDKVVFKK